MFCTRRRVTRASARDDDDAAVAILVYKEVNKAGASKADSKTCHFGDKAAGRRYAPSATSPWGMPQGSAAPAHRPGWTVSFSAKDDVLSAMDRVHGQPLRCALCSTFATMWIPFPPVVFRQEDRGSI